MSKDDYIEIRSLVDDEVFLSPRWLPQKSMRNCVVVPDRTELIRRLTWGGVVAEIGTDFGEFATQILEHTKPKELHIFDISFKRFPRHAFQPAMEARQVILHEGDSSSQMSEMPSEMFDWIYIDGDHSFEGVSRDIAQAKRLIKPEGVIVFNDYTVYSPLEKIQYGVMRAVNNLCLDDDFEIFILALNILGYHDVALRRAKPL